MAWLKEVDLDVTPAVTFKRAVSNKGWIIEGCDFDVFLWNSDKLLHQLLVALASWADVGQGKQLEIVRDNNEKRGFRVVPAVVKKQPVIVSYRLTHNGFTTIGEAVEDESNPFL